MGNVRLGIDLDKALELRNRYGLRYFVETGTYKGGTASLAAQHFEWVYTIEGYKPRYDKLQAALGSQRPANVAFLFGDSRRELARVLATINAPALLWLDAHWIGDAVTAHELGDECPLREELEAVLASAYADQHAIMIDDARLFTSPPDYPHDPAQWLTYGEIERLLAPRKPYICDDVIYAEPA